MSGRRPNLLYKSFHHRKKVFYLTLSLLFSTGLLLMDGCDIALLLIIQRPSITVHNARNALVVIHSLSFYLALLGVIYSLEIKNSVVIIPLLAAGFSILSVSVRVLKDWLTSGYFSIEYAVG